MLHGRHRQCRRSAGSGENQSGDDQARACSRSAAEITGAFSPPQLQDIPRLMETAKKSGLEILWLHDARAVILRNPPKILARENQIIRLG